MSSSTLRVFVALLSLAVIAGACTARPEASTPQEAIVEPNALIQYLEIVTPDVDAKCAALEQLHGVSFGAPVAELGNARTATFAGGGRIGVRAPMRADEPPVVRPYLLVEDIEAAVAAAQAAGAQLAVPPMEIPGQGTFALYIQGGNDHGLWQL